jgi:hypothetical protein
MEIRMEKGFRLVCVAAAAVLIFAGSCASGGSGAVRIADIYRGYGENESMLGAINAAKMDAVRNSVIDLIGAANEAAHAAELETQLYGTSNPNAFVYKDTLNALRKDKRGDIFTYEIEIRVNLPAVRSVLDRIGAAGGATVVTERATEQSGRDAAELTKTAAASVEPAPEDYAQPSARDAQFIRRYVDAMTYMVYFNESTVQDEFLAKAAVGMANEFLASNSIEAVDLGQIEELKTDRRLAYETETGSEIGVLQWIAQKLNADVYIEIDAVTRGEGGKNGFYGTANITLKLFEASTGRLLGSVPYNSPRAFSTSSEYDAVVNALQSSVYKAMPIAVSQAKAYMEKALTRGIRYDVVIQSTPDSRVMSRFRTKLMERVHDVETAYQSPEETKYIVYFLGRIDDLESVIYDAADTVPGLEGIRQVLLRGKEITFNSGM